MDKKIKELTEAYKQYAEENGFKLNPDKKIVEGLVRSLLLNEKDYGGKYCPCRLRRGIPEEDKKIECPCIYHKDEIKEQGHCHCFLFVK